MEKSQDPHHRRKLVSYSLSFPDVEYVRLIDSGDTVSMIDGRLFDKLVGQSTYRVNTTVHAEFE